MPQPTPTSDRYVVGVQDSLDDTVPSISIPTNDPTAALQFCRQLAALLGAPSMLGAPEHKKSLNGHQPLPMLLPAPELSVVVPVYNEEENLPILRRRLGQVLDQTGM